MDTTSGDAPARRHFLHFEFFQGAANVAHFTMHVFLKWASIALLASALVLMLSVSADVCTTTELTQLTSVVTTYSSSPDCTGGALDRGTDNVAVICAGTCMKLVRQLQPDTPDCEYDGTNLGESMSRLVAWCDAASASTSGPASSSFNSSASILISIDTLGTVPVCSLENVTLISEINKEAAKSADCFGMAAAATSTGSKDEYCAKNACVAYLADVKTRLPNCTYGGYNIKQVIADRLTLCDDSSSTRPLSTASTVTRVTSTKAWNATISSPSASSSALY